MVLESGEAALYFKCNDHVVPFVRPNEQIESLKKILDNLDVTLYPIEHISDDTYLLNGDKYFTAEGLLFRIYLIASVFDEQDKQ